MAPSDDLFAVNPKARAQLVPLYGQLPALLVDDIFVDPRRVREAALNLPYQPGGAHYPGRTARMPPENKSLGDFIRVVVQLIERTYLPALPAFADGSRLTKIRSVDTDFAITDLQPAELTREQSRPHIDGVPVFGLVYLNEIDRGGTLFFRPRRHTGAPARRHGYQVESDEFIEVCGKIEGRFNRLAIYPGFIHHSGEIKGDWIDSDERLKSPRLTQRIMFFF